MITDTILVVEDDENDAFFLLRAIQKAGITDRVYNAKDGQEAIDYLQGSGKFGRRSDFPLPRLILLDLKLPFVMGLDVLKWIRENSGLSVIVIILTSSAEETDVEAAYRSGANAYLVKPSEASRLEGLTRAVRDFWLLQNTAPCWKPGHPLPRKERLQDERFDCDTYPTPSSTLRAPEMLPRTGL